MSEGWTGFTVGFLTALLFMVVFCAVKVRTIGKGFQNVTSKIVVYERYDRLDLKSKASAIDKCDKLLECNGYVLTATDNENWADGEYIVVVGEKRNVK